MPEKPCSTPGCRRVATKHMTVTLGTIPLDYDYCSRCAVRVELDLYKAGYKPVFSELEKEEK